ncbi:MAG: amidohydrolase family protein, partial [Flavobacteriales bacterium]|nr:amidohydrolase family protein [Flavobacteriales bacterium]
HGKKRDILIEDGIILDIKASISEKENDQVIKMKNLSVSLGWVDLGARACDPGYEQKEDLNSSLNALAKGGFTHSVILPSSSPLPDEKSIVDYIIQSSDHHLVETLPAGTISKGGKGAQLSEMYDMLSSGAVAFCDETPVDRADLINRSLEYCKSLKGLVYSLAFDRDLSNKGLMHEGEVSTRMGVAGIPPLAEEARLARDLEILRYTEGRLHVFGISTTRSVQLIKAAKKEGLKVTASIAAHQLCYTDEDLVEYDSNFKVRPPFRTKNDISALVKGLEDGTIDAIHSDHQPQLIEDKNREFQHAKFGISSAETFLNFALQSKKKLEMDTFIQAATVNPRQVLGLDIPKLEKGALADLTVFCEDAETNHERPYWQSKSTNNPLYNQVVPGKVVALFNRGKALRFD